MLWKLVKVGVVVVIIIYYPCFRASPDSLTSWKVFKYFNILRKQITIVFRGGMLSRMVSEGFPGGAVVESLPASAGDAGSSPGLGGSHMPRSN